MLLCIHGLRIFWDRYYFFEPNQEPQSLQARYEEVKNSADKYQILQVGLTICHEDTKNGQIFSSCPPLWIPTVDLDPRQRRIL